VKKNKKLNKLLEKYDRECANFEKLGIYYVYNVNVLIKQLTERKTL